MQRRNVNALAGGASSSNAQTSGSTSPTINKRSRSWARPKKDGNGGVSAGVLIAVAIVITIVTYLYPTQVENEAQYLSHGVYEAERKVENWWNRKGRATTPKKLSMQDLLNMSPEEKAASQAAATARMEAQDSTWVDGEKKLKQKLLKLVARQAQGLDLGVPTLTRHIPHDPDLPAWPDGTITEAEWHERVKAGYAKMAEDEKEWRRKMAALIDIEDKNRG